MYQLSRTLLLCLVVLFPTSMTHAQEEEIIPRIQSFGPDGIVSLEMEHFNLNTPQGSHEWIYYNEENSGGIGGGYSGDGFMRCEPDPGNINAGYETSSPVMDYDIFFVRTGLHYVWVRYWATGTGDNSCHVSLDNVMTGGWRMHTGDGRNSWQWANGTWDGNRATVLVESVGYHYLNVWMREGGLRIDKIILTPNPEYKPEG
ncbi:MAG: hypothetical protein MI892_23990, partial [Desulfobacterales bacterium]|nr:hypothetical protein [Desulfobacterales bacterium]